MEGHKLNYYRELLYSRYHGLSEPNPKEVNKRKYIKKNENSRLGSSLIMNEGISTTTTPSLPSSSNSLMSIQNLQSPPLSPRLQLLRTSFDSTPSSSSSSSEVMNICDYIAQTDGTFHSTAVQSVPLKEVLCSSHLNILVCKFFYFIVIYFNLE